MPFAQPCPAHWASGLVVACVYHHIPRALPDSAPPIRLRPRPSAPERRDGGIFAVRGQLSAPHGIASESPRSTGRERPGAGVDRVMDGFVTETMLDEGEGEVRVSRPLGAPAFEALVARVPSEDMPTWE